MGLLKMSLPKLFRCAWFPRMVTTDGLYLAVTRRFGPNICDHTS